MEKFVVHGGIPLSGSITPSGNKNEALPVLAATLLAQGLVIYITFQTFLTSLLCADCWKV